MRRSPPLLERPRSMKTILLISNKVPHYRVSVYNYLSRRFREHGWELKVAKRDEMQPQSKLDVKFDFREIKFNFSKYRQLINEIRPEIVMFHLHLKDPIFWQLIHWLKLRKTPMISWTKEPIWTGPTAGCVITCSIIFTV